MLGSLGGGELLLLVLVGLIVFGPERLPAVARDAARVIKQLRTMANSARDEITSELGPELKDLDLRSMHPRALIEKHLLSDDDEDESRSLPVDRSAPSRAAQDARGPDGRAAQVGAVRLTKDAGSRDAVSTDGPAPTRYDADAT